MLSSASHSLPPLATSSRKTLTLTCHSHEPLAKTRCCPCGRRHLLSASAAAAALLPSLPSKAATDLTDRVERFHPSRPDWYEEFYANAMEQGMRDYEDEIAGYKLELFNHLSRESKSVIELGVGTGPNFKYYANVAGLNVFGVDPNKQMEKYARAAAVAAGLAPKQFTFLRGVGEALPVRDNSMDVVVGTLVLCSVKDVNMALAGDTTLKDQQYVNGLWPIVEEDSLLLRSDPSSSQILSNIMDPGIDIADSTQCILAGLYKKQRTSTTNIPECQPDAVSNLQSMATNVTYSRFDQVAIGLNQLPFHK